VHILGSRQEAVILADLEVMIVRASLTLSRAAALRLELTLVRMSSKADWSCRTCELTMQWRIESESRQSVTEFLEHSGTE
jgi:hypothetical protein